MAFNLPAAPPEHDQKNQSVVRRDVQAILEELRRRIMALESA